MDWVESIWSLYLSCCRYWSVSSLTLWVPGQDHESHFLYGVTHSCGYCYICKVNAETTTSKSPRSVLTHALILCEMPHLQEMRSVPTETLADAFLFLWCPMQCHLPGGSPVLHSGDHLPHPTIPTPALCVGWPRHTVWHVQMICPPHPIWASSAVFGQWWCVSTSEWWDYHKHYFLMLLFDFG